MQYCFRWALSNSQRRCRSLMAALLSSRMSSQQLIGRRNLILIHFHLRMLSSISFTQSSPNIEHRIMDNRTEPNQSLQLTAGPCDDQLEFMKHVADVTKARSRQR